MFSQKNIKFWKTLGLIFILLTAISTVMTIVSFYDRRSIRALIESRQKIGLVIIRAGERHETFTPEEKTVICANWEAAGYATSGEKCPK